MFLLVLLSPNSFFQLHDYRPFSIQGCAALHAGRVPVGLMSSVVAPEKPTSNTMGPKEVSAYLTQILD